MIWKTGIELDVVNSRQSIIVVHGDKHLTLSVGTKYELSSILKPERFIAWCYELELIESIKENLSQRLKQ